jgi:hypothetical protein
VLETVLTIFSTAKPFRGQAAIAQRNALRSWRLLHSGCEVILFGNEYGAREAALELGVRHVPEAARSEYGSIRVDYMFACAQEIAANDLLCYANCDIILLPCFLRAVRCVAEWSRQFLMIGRRWDTPLTRAVDFEDPEWPKKLRKFVTCFGMRQRSYAVDYFVFSRGLYKDVPPFVVARTHWDHWMVWKARSMKIPVIDASADTLAVHQNHDFGYHPGGLDGIKADPESKRNRALAGGQLHLYTIVHASHLLVDGRIENRPGRWHVPLTSLVRTYSSQLWYRLLALTFRARHAVGLYRRRTSADMLKIARSAAKTPQ